MLPRKTFVFTMTTGRSGTAFLASLLRQNIPHGICHHEIIGWDRFGVDTPEVSHMTLFNSKGNVAEIQAFWQQKFERIAALPTDVYCETSHVLLKAGLVENLHHLRRHGDVHLIDLRRDVYQTAASLRTRGDFFNLGNLWMWYLDPSYPNNLVKINGRLPTSAQCVWYILEMRARSAYYKRLLADKAWIKYHCVDLGTINRRSGAAALLAALGQERPEREVVMPKASNESPKDATLPTSEKDLIRKVIADTRGIDIERCAEEAVRSGFRFARSLV